MYVHFAFGQLGRHGNIEEQTDSVIGLILGEKRLKASPCPEFVPAFPGPGLRLVLGDPEVKNGKVVSKLLGTSHEKTITYLPVEVWMICFIGTAFNQLATSTHSRHYGKFGIVLKSDFLRKKGVRPVEYYTEESVWTNPLIKKWNYYTANNLHPDKHKELQDEIVSYRKPATLFPSFLKLTTIQISKNKEGLSAQRYTYNRYPERYDFTKENEYRLVFNNGDGVLPFNESDLYMIIAPDPRAKRRVEEYLRTSWSYQPHVEAFPG